MGAVRMRYASVNRKSCVACGTCFGVCPIGAVNIYKGCYAVVDLNKCAGCGRCADNCPTACISILKREDGE